MKKLHFATTFTLCLLAALTYRNAPAQEKGGPRVKAGWIESGRILADSSLELTYYPIADLQEYIHATLIDKRTPDVTKDKRPKRLVIVPYLPENKAEDMLRAIEKDSCRVFGIADHPDYKNVILMMIHPDRVQRHKMWYEQVKWE